MVEPEPEIVTCFEPEFETGCPVPAAFDSHMVYNGDSGDEYKKYCDYMTAGSCSDNFCSSFFKDYCRNECLDAKLNSAPTS